MSDIRSPKKADYRIKASKPGIKLDSIQNSKSLPPVKLKPYLRYSGNQPNDTKAVLLNTVIEEHLLKFGLISTFDIFIKEVAEKASKTAISGAKVVPIKDVQDKALESFKKGNDKVFFANWQKCITRKRLANPEWEPNEELEIKLRAYMAIYHLNPHSGSEVRCGLIKMIDEDVILTESTRRLDEFRAYLNSHAAEFMGKEDYSSYFNIPFILSVEGDRQEEFKDFFESSWAEGVQADLQASLEDMCQISDEPDSLAEGAGSQLEQMLKFYVRHNSAGSNTEPNTKWEEIEMRAEEAAAGIEKEKHSNKKKTAELNMLANKYEGLKIEYECFLEQIEEKYKTEFTFHNGMLLVESKFRKAAVDDREKHEAETMKNLQKDLGRKLNIQEVRVFKTQYKEKLMNYKLLSYIGSKNSVQVNHTRQMWKRIVFEYAHVAYRLVVGNAGGKGIPIGHGDVDQSINKKSGVKDASQKGSKKELPTNKKPVKVEPKEDVEKYEKKMESMEKDFSELEPRLNSSPDVLEKLLKELKIDDLVNFDKQYALEEDYIESCIEVTEEDLKRIEVQKQAALIGQSENPSEVSKPKIPEEKPKNEADKLEKKVTITELKDKPKFSVDIRERTRISLAVLNQKMAYKEKVHLPKENLFLEQILINITSMINRLCKINSEVTKDLFLELELSLYFLLHSTRDNELVKARLRKEDYIVNHCKIMYKHVEDHSKALSENNKLKTYTLTLLKLSRLVLEIYNSVPQQLQTILPVFIHMQTSQDSLEVETELKPDMRAQLASCTAAASKRCGDLQPEDRSGLASFLIEYLSKPIAEKVPAIVEVELEACLISLAAAGVHEKLTEYEKIQELVDQLENSESLKHTKTAKLLLRALADKTNSKVEPEGVDDVLDKFLEKVNSRVSTAIFAYDTKRAELALWEKDNHQVESELEILKWELASLDEALDQAKKDAEAAKAKKKESADKDDKDGKKKKDGKDAKDDKDGKSSKSKKASSKSKKEKK